MCGTAGLFTGCAAAAFCPTEALRGASAPAEYRSAFAQWDVRAAVRAAPRRELGDGTLDLFPEELVPVASHELIRRLRPHLRRRLVTQQLYRYLDFTAKLEFLVVNHVALGIAHGSVRVPIPEEMRFDAFKIYCDEAYHALFSVDLARQVRGQTGIEPIGREPFFLARLEQLKAEHESSAASLIDLLFTIVSETLISATLNDVGKSETIEPAVTEVVRDHALDEGRHHAYFAVYLRHLWAVLDQKQRAFASRLFPRLIDIFLRPDVEGIGEELLQYGLSRDEIDQILEETFSERIQRSYNRATASRLLGYLDDLGALDGAEASDLMEFTRLVPDQ